MGYKIKRFRCPNQQGEYVNTTFQYILLACGTAYEPCPPSAHHENSIGEQMIRTIIEKAWAMLIDSEAPNQFWGKAVNTAFYLHQRSPTKGLKLNDRDGYKALYETTYEMLHGFGKLTHDADGKEILYQATLPNLHQFGCYASRLIPKGQRRQGKLSPRSKPYMIVGYTHDSKMLWRIWDP